MAGGGGEKKKKMGLFQPKWSFQPVLRLGFNYLQNSFLILVAKIKANSLF